DWGWAETLDTAQRTRIAAGDVPHIVGGEVFMPVYAAEGILYPLPQDIVDSVVPSALLHDNNGVPVAVIGGGGSVFMLFYNRDILEAAGFSNPPATWDEWRHQSRVITETVPGAWGGGVPSFPHAGGALRATPFFRQLGVDFFQDGRVMLDDPRLHQSLEFIRYMDQFLPPGLGNSADEGPLWDAFEQDQIIAFVVNGTWQVGGAERNDMNWGVAPLPLPTGGQYGNCFVGVTFFGVPRGAPHPDISFDLIRVTLRPEVSAESFRNNRASPVRALHARTDLFGHSEALTVAMGAFYEGGFSGLVSFPRNSADIWDLINNQVLARTTMTNDPIPTITDDALRQVNMLLN
ncbi:MAG: extracellular solute-binding protein, partial [Defluviitaleaceae bacterium]|nr:extracellular solute-binding protein [Defluviitaleaceae bacterium]